MTSRLATFIRNPSWGALAAFYAGLTLIYAWPLLLVMGSALPNDTGDPGLIAWGLWWNAHALPFTERWWNAPMFFPLPGALALSETFLGIAPIATPLQWAGASAVTAYNLTYLLSFPAAALAAHALARRLTGRHDVAFIAGLAFGFSPYRASQLPHLHLLVSWWMPLCLIALHRFIETRRARDLALLGVCWLLNGLTTGYYLIYFGLLVALWMVWFVRRWRDVVWIGLTLGAASLPILATLAGYQHYQARLGLERSPGEIETFSADLSAIWAASPYVWLPHHWTVEPRPEGELYAGATIMAIALVGLIAAWRALPTGRRLRIQKILALAGLVMASATLIAWLSGGWRFSLFGLAISMTRPHRQVTFVLWLLGAAVLCDRRLIEIWRRRSPLAFYALSAVVMIILALGPVGHAFGVRFMNHAPYWWLMQLPGGHSLRVPARFAMLWVLCLSQVAALAFTRLTPRGVRVPVLAAVALAVALEGWIPKLQTAAVPPQIPLGGIAEGAAVLELPMRDLYSDTAALLHATVHGRPTVNGFSGYGPPHYEPLQEGLRTFDTSVLRALQQFAPLLVVIDRAADDQGHNTDFLERVTDARRVLQTPAFFVYKLPSYPLADVAAAGADRALPIASVEANANGPIAWTMTDGNMATQWQSDGPQAPGDEIVVTLDRPATISRIEMDLGSFRNNYPRQLRISVADPGAAPVVVWERGTAGPAVLAALRDNVRTPLSIDLPAAVTGRRLVLTSMAGDLNFYWSIAELRVFGRQP